MRPPCSLFLFVLLALCVASCKKAAEEEEPAGPLQGTWVMGSFTTYELDQNFRVVTQFDKPSHGNHVVISDSLMHVLYGTPPAPSPYYPPFPCKRDGDSLRILYDRLPHWQAQAIIKLTAHELVLRWRLPHSTAVHYPTGKAYYELIEQHYSR